MGIPGAFGFVTSNIEFMEVRKLKNCYLIIDGSNVYRHFYKMWNLESKFGGSYDEYHEHLVDLFLNFKKCNITPVVVFDGINDEKKSFVRKSRWLQQFNKLKKLHQYEDVGFSPLLSLDVFLSVLDELGVIYLVSLTEADKDVAILASSLNCAVLSWDSDYFFFNIQAIPGPWMDFQLQKDESADGSDDYYFECYIFNRKTFLNKFKLDQELMLVLPILLGKEQLQEDVFDNFLEVFLRLSPDQNIKKKIQTVLTWLGEIGSFHSAKEYIISNIPKCKKLEVMDIIDHVVEYYNLDCELMRHFVSIDKSAGRLMIHQDMKQHIPNWHPLKRCPEFVIRQFIKCWVNPALFRSQIKGVMFSGFQYEDIEEPFSERITLPLFSAQLAVADKLAGVEVVRSLYVRNRRNGFREILLYNSEKFMSHVTIAALTGETKMRKKLLLDTIGFGDGMEYDWSEIDEDWQLFLIAVAYWKKHRTHHMSPAKCELVKLDAVIMTALANNAENRIKMLKVGSANSQGMDNIPEPEVLKFAEIMRDFRCEIREFGYCLSTVHGFALLQCCVREVNDLNKLFNVPFSTTGIERFFSGTIAYNLNKLMGSSVFSEISKSIPNVLKLLSYLTEKVEELVDRLKDWNDC